MRNGKLKFYKFLIFLPTLRSPAHFSPLAKPPVSYVVAYVTMFGLMLLQKSNKLTPVPLPRFTVLVTTSTMCYILIIDFDSKVWWENTNTNVHSGFIFNCIL